MTSLPQTDSDLAERGYRAFIQAAKRGELRNLSLWRPEALSEFRLAFVDDEISLSWLQVLDRDFGPDYTVTVAGSEDLATYQHRLNGICALVRVTRGDGSKLLFILRPEEPFIEPIIVINIRL